MRRQHYATGIWSGSLTLMCLSGMFCSTLGVIIPEIQPVMKYLGAAYILPYESRVSMLFGFAVYLMILGALGNLIWAFAGNVLKRGYNSYYRMMNGVMALLPVWCSLRIVGVL